MIKVGLNLRWLTTENFKITNCEKWLYYVQKTKKNKLRWPATDLDFILLHTGCPIAHAKINLKYDEKQSLIVNLNLGSSSFT